MVNLKITLSHDELIKLQIDEFAFIEENGRLLLKFKISGKDIIYSISNDTREPNLEAIKDYISELLREGELSIREFSDRHYLYVSGKAATERQFTGIRLTEFN